MIIDFKTNCNNYEEKILKNYSIFSYTCPKCGAKHSFIRHGIYERNICFMENYHNITEKKMSVLRLMCTSCGSTHAILPNDIIPYCIYSFSTVINVLTRYYVNKDKVTSIVQNLSLSFQLIYNFISRFLEFLNSCLSVLKNLSVTNVSPIPSELVDAINRYESTNNFLYQYFFNAKWPFLMKKFHNVLSTIIFISGDG